MTLRNNFRVEFIGGPNDGEVIYSGLSPSEEFLFELRTDTKKEVHSYTLHWSNSFQARYKYAGVK